MASKRTIISEVPVRINLINTKIMMKIEYMARMTIFYNNDDKEINNKKDDVKSITILK